MEATKTPTKQELITLAYNVVYDDPKLLIEDFAKVFALTNMGQQLVDFIGSPTLAARMPGSILRGCYNALYQDSESDEMARGTEAERKGWLKDARKVVKLLQQQKLPLTMRNAEDAWRAK
jgi:hypothetical protein